MITLIGVSLVLGLSSSLHCIGMCGPIAMILPVQREKPIIKGIKTIIYHSGRAFVYAILGALIGLLGQSFQLMGILQIFSVLIGVLIIVGVMFPRIFSKVKVFGAAYLKFNSFIHLVFGKLIKQKSFMAMFLLGAVNGLLPCGEVYLALIGSLVYGNAIHGALFMVFFGLGTLPAMALITYFAGNLSLSLRSNFKKVAPVVMLVFGVMFVARGMNLDIPYLSPKVEINDAGETEVSCCANKGTETCVSNKKSKTKKQ
jgi:sulfite exporter TauE/SafE